MLSFFVLFLVSLLLYEVFLFFSFIRSFYSFFISLFLSFSLWLPFAYTFHSETFSTYFSIVSRNFTFCSLSFSTPNVSLFTLSSSHIIPPPHAHAHTQTYTRSQSERDEEKARMIRHIFPICGCNHDQPLSFTSLLIIPVLHKYPPNLLQATYLTSAVKSPSAIGSSASLVPPLLPMKNISSLFLSLLQSLSGFGDAGVKNVRVAGVWVGAGEKKGPS